MSDPILAAAQSAVQSKLRAVPELDLEQVDPAQRELAQALLDLARLGVRQRRQLVRLKSSLLNDIDALALVVERIAVGAFADVRAEVQLEEMETLQIGIQDMARRLQRTREELEQKVAQLSANEDQLRREREHAEAAARAKGDFLANMSHEIRTPMSAIIGLSDLMLRTQLTDRQRDYASKVRHSGNHLLGIINDILDFSKIEAGRLVLDRSRFDVCEAVTNAVDMFRERARSKGIELALELGEDVPRDVLGDGLRLGQVLINLLGNAVKFTERGRVGLCVERLDAVAPSVSLRFTVRDTGLGIRPEQVRRIFEPFTQADTSTTRRFGGTGLGLAISRQLVELMGGQLSVQGEPGQGSVFAFSVPLEIAPLDLGERGLPEDLRGLPVLVVDDNEASRELLEQLLRSYQLRPRAVADGRAALRELQPVAGREPYRLVLMDWRMPGMDGLQLARRILGQPTHAELPIVMVTAYGREEVRRKAENIGVRGFLHKPVKPSVLFDTLVGLLGAELAGSRARTHEESRAATQAAALLRGVRVLLVEDNSINQQVATELLEEVGVQVHIANDGAQAVRAVAAGSFDAILMDVQMPEMDGYQATGVLRGTHPWPPGVGPAPALPSDVHRVPIIAMTAHALKGDRERCLAAGMDDYVTKPIDSAQLFRVLARWVGGAPVADAPKVSPAPPVLARAAGVPADAELPESLPESLPGVDLDGARVKLGGRGALLRRVLRDFRRDNEACGIELRDALARGELDLAVRMAHTVKGVSGLFCARALTAAAAALEGGLRTAGAAERERLLACFDVALKEVVGGIGAWQERTEADEEASTTAPGALPAEAVQAEELRGAVAELRGLLQRRSMKAQRAAEALTGQLGGHPGASLLADLRQALARFDFRVASGLAEQLAAALEPALPGGQA